MRCSEERPNIALFTDLEGISGVEDTSQLAPCSRQYQIFITEETNAAIRGFKKGGAGKIFVVDSHGGGRWPNIRLDLLDNRAELISGTEVNRANRKEMEVNLGTKVDAAARLGNHARRQTSGFMSHSFTSYPPTRITVNEAEVGEVHFYNYWASSNEIPMIMFTGDNIALEEAESLVPEAERVLTKISLSRSRCELVHLETARKNVEEAAVRAIVRLKEIPVYKAPDVYNLEVSWNSRNHALAASMIPNASVKNENIITYMARNYHEAKSFVSSAITLAGAYEKEQLLSEISMMNQVQDKIAEWTVQRRKQVGADWELE